MCLLCVCKCKISCNHSFLSAAANNFSCQAPNTRASASCFPDWGGGRGANQHNQRLLSLLGSPRPSVPPPAGRGTPVLLTSAIPWVSAPARHPAPGGWTAHPQLGGCHIWKSPRVKEDSTHISPEPALQERTGFSALTYEKHLGGGMTLHKNAPGLEWSTFSFYSLCLLASF